MQASSKTHGMSNNARALIYLQRVASQGPANTENKAKSKRPTFKVLDPADAEMISHNSDELRATSKTHEVMRK